MKLCKVDQCFKWHYARGWCSVHYQRWRRTGSPTGSTRRYAEHGTASKYNSGCRCEDCTAAAVAKVTSWRLRRGISEWHYQLERRRRERLAAAIESGALHVRSEADLRHALTTGQVFVALPEVRQ